MEYKSQNVICQNCKNDFIIEPDDFSFYEKIKVPPPTFCPHCRMVRRFNFRNEGMLFRRLDSSSGQESFSGYPPEAKITTYENNYWFSDKWNSDNNFLDYNWSENFFVQFKKLLEISPIPIKSVYNLINSDYCNEASELKNCYLCFNVDFLENSAYARKSTHSKDVFDVYECAECELSYNSVILDKCYNTFFSYNCSNSFDVWFSKNLKNCSNCFACINLIGKSYCIFNKQYSKEEYFEYIQNLNLSSYKNFKNILEEASVFHLKFPNKYFNGYRNLNSSGDKIYDTKNVKFSYSVRNGENLKYCQDIQPGAANSYDYTIWGHGENIYESIVCGFGVFNLKFCFNCWENAKDLEYCAYCLNSSNCFGCVGLRNKQYCIFNKQYSKEEYFEIVEKIKKHMDEIPYVDKKGRVYKYGEFFPFEISPLSYNQSMIQDYFPLEKEEILDKGYVYSPIKRKEFEVTKKCVNLEDDIDLINESILKEVLGCENCDRAFKLIEKEFLFYKRFNLPIPRNCNFCRMEKLIKSVNPPKFYHLKCMKEGCSNEFETSYAPYRPEIVYCERCYQQEIY